MASRFICKSQLLKQSPIRQFSRSFASETKQSTEKFSQESFGTNAWRNTLIAVVGLAAWYRIDQHVTQSGDEKHPFTKWIEYHMTSSEEKDNLNAAKLAAAEAVAEYKLFYQDAQRPPIYRMRYPESFERASPRGLTTGNQVDLSDLKIRQD
ncbi:hypothetical protein G6F70_006276 [Rhizopus microsporus]|uniref:Uncharacterized protein n=2 Tax=Rhizopus TaxID=4842 RepID=A0A367JDU1_RHIAZ|nr:hypothetical protein G6F71_006130 [Rhizopus microsporus]RCH88039.1 hypothetical protein CU097_004342 [Rhizopus azygosporus]KAG1197890.1 hypothetical protein G6F70_006276 [Rhizopus microsporus]KAG1210937.1 hypothetical protein G6F69_005045 [Rhizopus microsporus]KAG1231263.1 hypothetical protein G6F67_005888 [Rhizopus microsporus]